MHLTLSLSASIEANPTMPSSIHSDVNEGNAASICSCIEGTAVCISRAWDDLALALVVNPALVARTLRLASEEGLDGVFLKVASPEDTSCSSKNNDHGNVQLIMYAELREWHMEVEAAENMPTMLHVPLVYVSGAV